MPDIEVIEVQVPGIQGPAPILEAASSTSLSVGGGAKSLTVTPASVVIATGMRVRIVNGDATKIMDGESTAWNSGSGALTVNVDYFEGSGSANDWTVICNAGVPGPASLFDGDATDVPTSEGGTFGGDDVETVLNALNAVFVGDSGTGGAKGLVPAPATGDASKFLKGDGSWATPAGGGGGTPGGADTQVQFNDGGAFGGDASFVFNKTTKLLGAQAIAVAMGTVANAETGVGITGTWNDASDIFNALLIQITNTASSTSAGLIRAQVDGTTRFSATRQGLVTAAGLTGEQAGYYARLTTDSATRMFFGLDSSDRAVLALGDGSSSRDTFLLRDAAGIFAIRNGNAEMGLRIYDAFTDASNYARLGLYPVSGSGYMEIVAETAGTGPDNIDIRLTPAGTGAVKINGNDVEKPLEPYHVPVSDETTALTAGTGKITWRMPYAFTVVAIRASLTTAQSSGSIFTVDINEGGSSILSTKLTIDNTEKTSVTAATAAVISDGSLADDAEMSIDIDQVGDGSAKGLKVVLIGRRT
jgi:hypothetical protein